MEIGEKIKKRRKELGLTLDEVAEKVGVGKSTVQKWESGRIKNMRRDKIELLAQVLDMSPLDFVSTSQLLDIAEKTINQEKLVIEEVEQIFGKNVSELVRRSNMLNDLGIIKLLERMEELIETPKYSHLDLYNKVQNELKKINKEEPPRIVQTEAPLKTEEPETILISASDGKPAKAITKEIVEKIENAPSHTDDY
jgi:transcriptional regulator with XRE-family HTH domain